MEPDNDTPREVVRAFMVTGLRTRSDVDVALESLVQTVPGIGRPDRLSTEQRALLDLAEDRLSVAELSAHLRLPLRTVLVLVGDLINDRLMTKAEVVDEVTYELLDKIRIALEAL